ncbi:MAG TPA: response regulator [Bacteroidales bacterium]|nr:response regulator [Bacteroidales bacterium]
MSEHLNSKVRKILVLEDEPAHAEAIIRQLSDSEYDCRVTVAGTLAEFGKIVQLIVPDLVIADINLPDGSSLSILRGDIESQPWPVLIMTSFGDEEIAVKAIKSGALDYIVKSPEAFNNIRHVVKRNLREWRNIQKSRESERKFRILFETMDQGVIYLDSTGHITAANSAAEKITGYALEEMQDMPFFNPGPWLNIDPDGSFVRCETHPAAIAMRSGTAVRERVMGIQNPKTDRFVWMLVSAIPQFRKGGSEPYQVFTTFTDISQLKEVENELIKARKKAEESDRLKSVFMANMSHEIRTPMNGILGFAELLKTPELSGESQKMYIEAITMSGKRMLDIINDLIDISRIEAGQTDLRKENTDMPVLIRELILFFRPEADKKGIYLRSQNELQDESSLIVTDKTKVAQVITNLIKNALKFTPRDGLVEVGCRLHDDHNLLVYVKDTGMGVRKELQGKIFERFRQGDGADVQEGVGLGLAISKAYVDMLGGRIGLDSEPGKGSIFYFTLPLTPGTESKAARAPEQRTETETVEGQCILVAEDDDLSYTLLKEALSRSNIVTCRAKTGKEAVELVKNKDNISLVLMDIRLPELNGMDATREIKKIKPEIAVIAQSAYISQSDIKSALDSGCDDYITKPIDIRLLLNKIAKHNLPVS